MATSVEKLTTMRDEVAPQLLELLTGATHSDDAVARRGSLLARPLIAFARPHVDRRIDAWLTRDPADLDADLAELIIWLGSLRSDDAHGVLAAGSGAGLIAPGLCALLLAEDQSRASDLRDGSDPVGEVDVGASDVLVGGGAEVGDRSGGLGVDGDPGGGDVLGPVEGDEPAG
jgi:hypothetical protein